MTTPTDKDIPSNSIQDRLYNAEKFDEFMNSDNSNYTDRKGKSRWTLNGIRQVITNWISSLGGADGASNIGVSDGSTLQSRVDYFTNTFSGLQSISVMAYIPKEYHSLIKSFALAQNSGIDFLPYINDAIAAAVSLGKFLDFPSGYFPVSDTVKQISECQVRGVPKQTFIIPTVSFPENKWLWVWPIRNGAPRKYLSGMGFQAYTGHTNVNSKRIGGFAIKSGCWFSTVREISISNCFYGGILINPQHPTSSTGVSDIVNLSIEHVWILDAGSTETNDCFEVNLNDVDSTSEYAESANQLAPYSMGAWTDGKIADIDISAADTDPKNYDDKGPIALGIYGSSTNKTMFNVLIQRIFTATRKQTHLYINHPKLYNCQFSNFSGETHSGTSGLSASSGMGEFSVYHVDIVDGGQWNTYDQFYANGSLGNNGLHVAKAMWLVFRNMTLDINYPGGQLVDNPTAYPKKITLDANANCVTFENCNIRGFEDSLWNLTYKQYRDIFSYIITDNGRNTNWNSATMSSDVATMQPLDWLTSVSSSGLPLNGTSESTIKPTCSQGSDLSMTVVLPADSTGAIREGEIRYYLSNLAPGYLGPFFVTLRIKINSADVASHYLKLQMFDTVRRIPIESTTNELTLFFNWNYSSTSPNKLLLLALGSGVSTTTDLSITILDFVISHNKYPYIPHYKTVLSPSAKIPSFKASNVWTGNNSWSGTNTYTGVNTFNNANFYVGRGYNGGSVGFNLGSKVTAGTAYQDFFSAGGEYSSARIQSTGGSTTVAYAGTLGLYAGNISFRAHLIPTAANTYDLASASLPVRNIYSQNTLTVISDRRHKTNEDVISDLVLDAWGSVNFSQWNLKTELALDPDHAPIHFGVIAQDIKAAFEAFGLIATDYGILVHHEWEAKETILDETGFVLEEGREAGDIWMVKMEECLVLEAAYQRREIEKLRQRLAS